MSSAWPTLRSQRLLEDVNDIQDHIEAREARIAALEAGYVELLHAALEEYEISGEDLQAICSGALAMLGVGSVGPAR